MATVKPASSTTKTAVKLTNGFSLIETLIAASLFSLVALGLITLQIKSTQASHQAQLHASALLLLQDMAERIRSNPVISKTGYYTQTHSQQNSPDCSNTNCTPQEAAQHEQSQWLRLIEKQLPKAHTKIQFNNNQYSLTLYWHSQTSYANCAENSADDSNINCQTLTVSL